MRQTLPIHRFFTTILFLAVTTLTWAYDFAVDGIYYDKNSNSTSVTVTYKTSSDRGYSGSVVIPSTVTYGGKTYSVTSIGESAFEGCSDLTSVTIPESVTSIGRWAFYDCSDLTKAEFASIESLCKIKFSGIDSNPLYYAKHLYIDGQEVTDVVIPNSVTNIGDLAFYGCSGLTSITIGSGVTSIGDYAFEDCSGLTSVTIPESVTSIGRDAFSGCSGLTSLKVEEGNPKYDSRNNCNAIIESSTNTLIAGCKTTTIPNSVTSIGQYAFYNFRSITSVTIPNSVTSIGEGAFFGCSGLTSVTIPNSVTSIGSSAFYRCSGLTSVTIPNSVTSIGDGAFSGCSGLTSITIPNSVTSIGAFSGCSGLTSVTIPNSVTSIGSSAFSGCSGLTSVTIPNSVTHIGSYAFNRCSSLTSVTIGNSVTHIGDRAFYGCSSLTSVTIPNSVTSIGDEAFSSCSGLTSVTIPNSVTHIGAWAFSGCSGLTSVTIPNSVTRIGKGAFQSCSGLTSVTLNVNDIVSKTYSSSSNLGTIFGSQVKEYVLGYDVKGIGQYAFYNCSGLTSVTIPNSVTSIGSSAFSGCSGLTSITIPNSVKSIGDGAFSGCSGLTSITIPNSVTSIGDGAFSGCSGLTSVTIPNSVTSIGNYAFFDCSGLTSVTLNVNDIVSKTYSSSSNLGTIFGSQVKEYVLGYDVKGIGDRAFSGCSGLTSVTIPNSVTSIGEDAFYDCSGLTSVTIPNSVTSIGKGAFQSCTSLTSITIPNSVTHIGDRAFSGCSRLEEVILNSNSIVSKTYTSTSNISTIFGSQVKKYIFGDNITGIGEYAFPSNTSIYVSAKSSLLAAWNYGISPYDLKTSVLLANPLPTIQTNTASSIHVSRNSSAEESGIIISSESITVAGKTITKIGHTTKFTGLTPGKAYTVAYNSTIKYGGSTFSYSKECEATTSALTFTTSQPKVISAGNVIVEAVSNLDDEEENVGFEWRRTDWTDDFASNTGTAYLYEGTMEGYIRNLNTEKLWKVRPYYQSGNGTYYYGQWIGLDPTNTSYFEPTVHTYAKINVTGNKALVSGYVQRGSDAVRKQGFKYWVSESSARVAADAGMDSRALAASAVPSGATTVEAEGRIMEAELSNLSYSTTYSYVAFVTTTEGETFYGKQLTFTTEDAPTGIDTLQADEAEDSATQTVSHDDTAIYDLNGRRLHEKPAHGFYIQGGKKYYGK